MPTIEARLYNTMLERAIGALGPTRITPPPEPEVCESDDARRGRWYDQGWMCCETGGCRADCPYHPNDEPDAHDSWMSGFDSAAMQCGDPDEVQPKGDA